MAPVAPVHHDLITSSPDLLGGTPVFAGTRVPVQSLWDYLEGGETLDEFLDDFPTVSRPIALQVLLRAKVKVLSEVPGSSDANSAG